MSSRPSPASCAGRDIARMRGAAHDVGRAHQHAEPGLLRGLRGLGRGREFGDADALLDRLVDMRDRGVVMAGEHDAALAAGRGDRRRGSAREFLADCAMRLSQIGAERLVRHLQLALVVHGIGFELGELALARRMVHQRRQLHPFVAVEMANASQAIGRRNLAAQMDEMVGAQPVLRGRCPRSRRPACACPRRSGRHPRPCRRAARRTPW